MNSYFIPVSNSFYHQSLNLIYTILKHDNHSQIYIGDLGLYDDQIQRFEDDSIHVLKMPEKYLTQIHSSRWPKEYLMKYLLPWLIPEEINKILCLGADMLVVNDVSSLFNIDMKGFALAASFEMSGNLAELRLPLFCELPSDRLYLNAELLLLNVEYFREMYSADQIIDEFVKLQDDIKFYDQDFINLFFYRKMIPLSPKFNLQVRELSNTSEAKMGLMNACVIHYSAKPKPWDYKCKPKWIRNYMKYSSKEFRSNLKIVLWKSYLYHISPLPYIRKIKKKIRYLPAFNRN